MRTLNKKKGISLIVLVIVIIVMIILAAAIILTLSGSDIRGKANEAVSSNDISVTKEVVSVASSEWELNYDELSDKHENFGKYAMNKLKSAGFDVGEGKKEAWFVSYDGKLLYSGMNTIYEDENLAYTIIPDGFVASKIESEDEISEGLVIYELKEGETSISDAEWSSMSRGDAGLLDVQEERNQFVWIPVGKTVNIGNQKTKINNPLERYSGNTKYGSQTIMLTEGGITYGCHVNTAETTDFISSVNKNGGYYIGRYEAKSARERTSADKSPSEDNLKEAKDKVTCKINDYVYNYINYFDALRLSKGMYTKSGFSSNLINSYAWDTALKYFEKVTGKKYSVQVSVNQGSETGKVNFCKKGTAVTTSKDVICNVYDMASNSYEWTTEVHRENVEVTPDGTKHLPSNIMRGGVYSSSTQNAGTRLICNHNTVGYHTQTFRVILYLD